MFTLPFLPLGNDDTPIKGTVFVIHSYSFNDDSNFVLLLEFASREGTDQTHEPPTGSLEQTVKPMVHWF